jgi:NADPH:quinone reductase-like Zn-dependent oxidoreductase
VSLFVRQRLAMLASKERATDLERLAEHLEAGTVRPTIDRTYPLDHLQDGMRHLIDGNVRGKVAITVSTEEGTS